MQACASLASPLRCSIALGAFRRASKARSAATCCCAGAIPRLRDAGRDRPRLRLGKVANQRAVLKRALRDHGDEFAADRKSAIDAAITRLAGIIRARGFRDARGSMCCAAARARPHRFISASSTISSARPIRISRFRGRSRRPPLDPMNALLSFLYTLLTHDCRSAAESVGLDPPLAFFTRIDLAAQVSRSI